jgi:uncharacterized protein YecT (DUF1311 family)
MLLVSLILAAAAAPVHVPAARASFDCGRAATDVERMICADPSLAARDRGMAIAYQLWRRGDNARFSGPQGGWLAERNACRSAACIADAYDGRFGEMMGELALLPAQFRRSDQTASLSMIDLGGGWHLFEISAVYVYPRGDNANTGGAAGVVRIANGTGVWRAHPMGRDEECILDFTHRGAGWSVRQAGDCATGLNVELGGLYRPLSRPRTHRR